MTGRKGVFVPAFVGDVHRAQAFARWLDAQLNMSVDGSLYPIGRDQDAFRRCAVVQVKFLRYHHRIVDFLAFPAIPLFILARVISPVECEYRYLPAVTLLRERVRHAVNRTQVDTAAGGLRQRRVNQQRTLEECSLIHQVEGGTVTTTDIVASLAFDDRASIGKLNAHVRRVLLLVPRTAKLDGQRFHELARLPEQRLRVSGAVDVFLFTGAEADDHFFVEEAERTGQPDRRPAEPHFAALFGDAVLQPFAPLHDPVNPLFLFRKQQKRDGDRQAIIDVTRVSSHPPVDDELCRVGAVKLL